jgi:hypothetical protein
MSSSTLVYSIHDYTEEAINKKMIEASQRTIGIAEVVGSNSTRSISFYEGTTALN